MISCLIHVYMLSIRLCIDTDRITVCGVFQQSKTECNYQNLSVFLWVFPFTFNIHLFTYTT